MRAVVLVDNIEHDSLECEWGLSIYIEFMDKKILLDCGKSDAFLNNAHKLSVDLACVDYMVLSHAHYDHSDGLPYFLDANDTAQLYFSSDAKEDCYHHSDIDTHYIGIRKGIIDTYADRIVYVEHCQKLCDNVYLIKHTCSGLEQIGKENFMYRLVDDEFKPDDFSHELSLVFDTDKGLVVFNSCSHAGVDVIIDEVKNAFPGKEIYAYIGGFHLFRQTDNYVEKFAKRISKYAVCKFYTGHCTGDKPYEILQHCLLDRLTQIYSGFEIEI